MQTRRNFHSRFAYSALFAFGISSMFVGVLLLMLTTVAAAQEASSFHPTFALLDADGENVLVSGAPASTMRTCGSCHDTAFIASHSGHADAGLQAMAEAGTVPHARAWEMSSGLYGAWDAITYRYLTPQGDARPDLTLPSWIQVYGARHVGGGPADVDLSTVSGWATQVVDPTSGTLAAWDWAQSGDVEMNCFLCHTAAPNNAARIAELQAGNFQWANSATLVGTGILEPITATCSAEVVLPAAAGRQWCWQRAGFNEDGTVRAELIAVQDHSDVNCGQCHGAVHNDNQVPLAFAVGDSAQWTTLTTGQVFSSQRLSATGLNLLNKSDLGRSWDVHAERVVGCTDCHYALNNPVYYVESAATRPDHLQFDPRRMDFGDYLYRPLHEFANTGAAAITDFGGVPRTCESCHDAVSTHTWLPYAEQHTAALACETCHVPTLYAPALEFVDWTVLQSDSTPVMRYRGVQRQGETALLTGFQPVLLPTTNEEGRIHLAPYNLVTAWYWVYGDPARPVSLRDLQAVWLDGDIYHEVIVAAFDADGSGTLDAAELVLDTEVKVTLIAERLAALGLDRPRIVGDVQSYAIHHNVTQGQWATRECSTCHTENSRLNAPITLSRYTPGGVLPTFVGGEVQVNGTLNPAQDGTLWYQPISANAPTDLYVLGHDSVGLVDLLGTLMFFGVLTIAFAHGGLRYVALRRLVGHQPAEVKRVYLYSVYERQWHWLQTAAIFGLLFTGLVIHRPDTFAMFNFQAVVLVHNALAVLLVINAALSAFYHIVSGEIRQFLPRPYGFFDQAFAQTKYYLYGIFKGEPHPMVKTRDRKMNPLQQITYLMILNVLLPLQILTGLLMWGAQQFPELTTQLGGLPLLAPFHTLVAWAFATFIVAHVYLTTTGHTPLSDIKAMITGWDDVEVGHTASDSQSTQPATGEAATS